MFRRSLIGSPSALGGAPARPPRPSPSVVHVRVEGKTQDDLRRRPSHASGRRNALDALDGGEHGGRVLLPRHEDLFGPYVDQIGRYAAGGSSGWVFKVNGVSPPVGADAGQLKDGDRVLWYWATFGARAGRRRSCSSRARKRGLLPRRLARTTPARRSSRAGRVLHVGAPQRARPQRDGRASQPHQGLVTRDADGRGALERPAVRRLALAAALSVALAGCGRGRAAPARRRVWVTRDRGHEVMHVATVPAGLDRDAGARAQGGGDTRYGGRYVRADRRRRASTGTARLVLLRQRLPRPTGARPSTGSATVT